MLSHNRGKVPGDSAHDHVLHFAFNLKPGNHPRANFKIQFEELATCVYSAFDYDKQHAAWDTYKSDFEDGNLHPTLYKLGEIDPVSVMKKLRVEAADMIEVLERLTGMLKYDLTRYDAWLNARKDVLADQTDPPATKFKN